MSPISKLKNPKSLIVDAYDSQAVGYSRFVQSAFDPWLEEIRAGIISNVSKAIEGPEGLVTDLGCGTGDLFSRLCSQQIQFRGVGVDISGNMLEQARSNLGRHDCQFMQGDIENLPLEDSCAEVVMSLNAIHFCSDFRKVGQEISRISSSASHGDLAFLGNRDFLPGIRTDKFLSQLPLRAEAKEAIQSLLSFPNLEQVSIMANELSNQKIEVKESFDIYYVRSLADIVLLLETKYSSIRYASADMFEEVRLAFSKHALNLASVSGIPLQSHFFRLTW